MTPPYPGHAIRIATCAGKFAIGATNLTKQFGAFTAVKNVNVQCQYGEIYGLLGANGAGKTTTIKMLCGLLEPTERRRWNSPANAAACDRRQVRQRIGYMSQKFSLYDDLTIDENLDFFAGVYGVPDSEREEKKRWVLAFSGLEGKEDQTDRQPAAAAGNSAWHLARRSCTSRACCFSMSPPRASIRWRAARSGA